MTNIDKLPEGYRTVDDEILISYLINDPVFINSVAEDWGPVTRIYPDWKENKLVYELLSGQIKSHDLKELIAYAKKVNYLKSFEN